MRDGASWSLGGSAANCYAVPDTLDMAAAFDPMPLEGGRAIEVEASLA